MSRLIDVAEAIKRINKYEIHVPDYMSGWAVKLVDAVKDDMKEVIFDIPTADVVNMVRCKDCTYWLDAKENEKGFFICPASGMEITEDDFCSYGEKVTE